MEDFVHRQNLIRFVDLLEDESSPVRRAQLEALLIEEEDRYGSLKERLFLAETFISGGQDRLQRQEALIAGLTRNGQGTDMADRLRTNMVRMLELFEAHRELLAARLDEISP